ncbi:hypothetical protein LHYA1_G008363 [Lachnellula hyalina]|uniref:Uncharacterized protein n=1 Tax=Lachnellula hyalina TaxID=1316788 RepID=A0A8H8TX70_9HELO|nr:uncharacterized protein LHYA1_G008363 [Lachnellula hyalina]TVY22661.1 hypothetical protein LHYA1_G008363 [Lachnellula hyalina]
MTEALPLVDNIEIFRQLETYPWDKDKEFQGGLSAILGPNPSPSQLEDLTLRAQCFYLSRKRSTPIDFDAYKTYLSTKQPPTPISNSKEPPTQTARQTTSENIPPSTTEDDMSITKTPPAQPNGDAPYPPTFKQIVELIQSGAPIPGIMDIPDTVLTGQGSTPQAPKRRKPWEKEDSEEVVGGTFGDARDEAPIEQEFPDNDDAPSLET